MGFHTYTDDINLTSVVIGSSLIIKDNGGGSSKVFKRGAKTVSKATTHTSHVNAERILTRQAEAEKKEQHRKLENAPVFTFKVSSIIP